MATSIIDRPSSKNQDLHKRAEAFVEKVVAPRRQALGQDSKAIRARAELGRKDLELARRELAASGLDAERLDKLAAERSTQRKKLAEESRRRAVEASAAVRDRLRDLGPVIFPLDPVDTVIDQVTFIRTFADQGVILESNVGPGDNWARYRLDSNSDVWSGTGRLSFFTLWQNQLSVPAVVMAQPNLVVNANFSCDADWSGVASWFGMSSVARGKAGLRTTVWGMDSSVSSIAQQQDLAEIAVDGGFFGDDSSQSIEFNEVLTATGVVVPAQAYNLIEVELLIDWSASGGASVTFDAESGSHRVDLPQLVLTVTPAEPLPPPISLAGSVSYTTSPARITLVWSGATGSQIDLYQNGVLLATTLNDGNASFTRPPGTYTFRVCDAGTAVCSADLTLTVTQ